MQAKSCYVKLIFLAFGTTRWARYLELERMWDLYPTNGLIAWVLCSTSSKLGQTTD